MQHKIGTAFGTVEMVAKDIWKTAAQVKFPEIHLSDEFATGLKRVVFQLPRLDGILDFCNHSLKDARGLDEYFRFESLAV